MARHRVLPAFDEMGVAFKTLGEVLAFDEKIVDAMQASLSKGKPGGVSNCLMVSALAAEYMERAGVTKTVGSWSEIKGGDVLKMPAVRGKYTWWRVGKKSGESIRLSLLFHIVNLDAGKTSMERLIAAGRVHKLDRLV